MESITCTDMRVTSKGQVTIPKAVRDRLGIREGSRVEFAEENGRFYLVRKENIHEIRARIASVVGTADAGLTTADIMRMTRGDDWDDGEPPYVVSRFERPG